MTRAGSLASSLTGPRLLAWLENNRQYLVLILLDLVLFSAWSVFSGIAPGGDIREHIFRTLEFTQGLTAGDYTSIQYHGYAFLAGYGVGFYAFTWIAYSVFGFFVASFQAATIANNVMWVLTPLVLAISAVALADELGMKNSSHHRLMQLLLGATVLILPGGGTDMTGADPYMLSFSFSLLALVYGLRTRDDQGALRGLLAFSALSIFSEGFGYFFIAAVFLGLTAARRPVLKIIPLLAAVCAFSWVQLLEVSGFTSPYIEEIPVLGLSFLTLFGIMTAVVCGYFLVAFALRERIDERLVAVNVFLAVTAVAAAAAVARGSLGWNFGLLNGVVDNILPWRLFFVNVSVLLVVLVYALSAGKIGFPNLKKAVVLASILLISVPVLVGAYPVAFGSVPSANYYEQFSGDRLLVAGPALTTPSSLIAYSPAFGYSTVGGAFSQGDPSFFSLTAYYEWSDNFVANGVVTENLLHITGANELITSTGEIADTPGTPSNTTQVPYSQAEAVTPLLLEGANSTEVLQFALFVNLLGKDGFMLDFVTSAPAGEVYGAVVLPGYRGVTPSGLPRYSAENLSLAQIDSSVPVVGPFITPPFDLFGPVSNASIDTASSLAASLISYFHPTYAPVTIQAGSNSYSVTSNTSLPIQLAVSYYPYFSPANYSQNVYRFILLPAPEKITWNLPFYQVAAACSLLSSLGAVVYWSLRRRDPPLRAGTDAPKEPKTAPG